MAIKISVIVPTMNSQKFIGYALMSIKDYVDEIIVVDMASTDGTANIIGAIGDKKIRLYQLIDLVKNRSEFNLDYSIKYGLDLTSGNAVVRMDDDWIWGPEIKNLRKYCDEGFTHSKQGLVCFVYNMLTTGTYFLPMRRRPTVMFKLNDANPLVSAGSYLADDSIICHQSEVRKSKGRVKRSTYLRTPLRFGHWKFLKDTQTTFVRKWVLFRRETEEQALEKWHHYQKQPTDICPNDLKDNLYEYKDFFVPLGGFNIDEAVEQEMRRRRKFERAAKERMRERLNQLRNPK